MVTLSMPETLISRSPVRSFGFFCLTKIRTSDSLLMPKFDFILTDGRSTLDTRVDEIPESALNADSRLKNYKIMIYQPGNILK